MRDFISKLLNENLQRHQTEYVVFEIDIPMANMNMDYYFQARPKHELETGRVFVKKGSAGSKSISTKSITVLKTFILPEQEEEMNSYLDYLRKSAR